MLVEDAAQALGVLGCGAHFDPALAEGGARPGVAGLDHDGPAHQVFLRALGRGGGQVGPAVGVQDEVATPVLGRGDEV